MKLVTKALLTASAMILAVPATAAVQVTNSSGILTGATGVIVGGNIYDVTFLDGTCASVYGACTQSSFDFTAGDAMEAAKALLSQVFLDTDMGAFDTNPALTFGCGLGSCSTDIAFSINAGGYLKASATNTRSAGSPSYATGVSTSALSYDTTTRQQENFARFKLTGALPPSAPAVPEPATWAMMLVGFAMVGAAVRYRRRNVAITFG